jgi:hypothetical protein
VLGLIIAVVVGSTILGHTPIGSATREPVKPRLLLADPSAPATIVDPDVSRPDPFVMWDPVVQRFRMYTTNAQLLHVPMWLSDKVTGPWERAGEGLPVLPDWASDDFRVWAPEVAFINGLWTMWGSAGVKDTPSLCLFRATAAAPAGPFVVDGAPPRLCDISAGGTIDSHMTEDEAGTWWLSFKPNLNVYGVRTRLDSVQLDADGLPTGPVRTLIEASEPWMHDMIESPSFVKDPERNQWWLFFSAGFFAGETPNYRIAGVPCDEPRGPCSVQGLVTLVVTNNQGTGPGELSAFTDRDGAIWMSYNPAAPFVPTVRPLAVVRLAFDDAGVPYVARSDQ